MLEEKKFYDFNNFRLDLEERVLSRNGEKLPLTPKAFHLLKVLIEHRGHVIEKNELMAEIWADSFVEQGNLAFNICQLRIALGDDAHKPTFIETVPRRGYRFIAEVKEPADITSPASKTAKDKLHQPSQKPFFLIGIGIILLISVFGFAFVWVNGELSFVPKQRQFTQITSNGKVTNLAVTPDGKNIIFAQKEGVGESLWLRQIDTGNQTQLLPPEDVRFVGLSVSPDNKYAYYSVFSTNSVALTLSRVVLSGGKPEQLSEITTDVSVSFSPDGKKFAFTESQSAVKETHLKTADANGSNQKILAKTKSENRMFPVFHASPVAWSPDGLTIACVVQEIDENNSFNRILLVNPKDGSEKYLSEKSWGVIEYITWRDNENLALIEYNLNSPVTHIWEVSRKTGEVIQLNNDLSKYEWLSSASGILYSVQKNSSSTLNVADFVENTNNLKPIQVFAESGRIDDIAWSKDGKILYNSWASGKNEIWKINPDGTAPQQLTTNSNLAFSFTVSPADNTIVFASLRDGKISLSAADYNGQNVRQLTDGTPDFSPSFSPDGKYVVFQRGSSIPTLWVVEVEGHNSPIQITGYYASHPSISPDGHTIAYHFMEHGGKDPHWKIGLINSENHRLLNKLEFPIPITERKTVWHPNKKLLTMIFNKGENVGILLLSATDGSFQTKENIAASKITSFAWSPEGCRFAFSQQIEKNDVVSLREF